MSKLIAYGALSAATLTSASVGGYYLFSPGGHVEEAEPGSAAPTPLSFDNLASFKRSAGADAVGIGEYFPELDLSKDADSVADDLTHAGSFFNNLKTNEPGAKSYLRIEHRKKTSQSWDWAGKFAWLWIFVTQDRGMITFGAAETISKTEFSAQAALYLVQNEESGWKLKHRKESGDKRIVKNEFDNQFPSPSDAFQNSKLADEIWGFMDKNNKSIWLSSMCVWEGCYAPLTIQKKTRKVLRWQTDEGSGNKSSPGSWFANSGWCKHFFGDVGEKLMKLQTPQGIWTADNSVS